VRSRPFSIPGTSISELTLGTWGLSGDAYGPVSEAEQDKIIERARALGITGFETADTYAQGAMESRLGNLLGADPEATFITKVGTDRDAHPARKRFDAAWLRERIEACATRLKRRTLDLVLLHNPSEHALKHGEAVELMKSLLQEGLLRSWGVSAGSAAVAMAAIDVGAPALQLALNCFWTDEFRSVAHRLKESNTRILARSVLAHGLLCGFWPPDKVFPEADHRSRRWSSDELRRRLLQLDALRPLVRDNVTSLRSVALRWVLNHPEIATAVIGPRSTQQLDQLVRDVSSAPPYLPESQLSGLETRLQDFGAR
jgi:aryl-alcohol dehydrogenase-like predicted oxidoreductase